MPRKPAAVEAGEVREEMAEVGAVVHRADGGYRAPRGDEPNELTRRTMLDVRAGRDVVWAEDKADLFRKLGL